MPTFTVFKGSKDGSIVKSQTTRPDLTGEQVLVKITVSGLCGTDEHYKHADMALGHEGAGVVEEVGPNVKHLKKGDRVGWGFQHGSCGECEACLSGNEQYCLKTEAYGGANTDQGSFGSHAVWKESFLFQIPDNITDEDAAPLMCGGATVFSALEAYGIKSTDRVGVLGVGGLGHMAIQFAAHMGCDVVVFSGTDSKKEEAKKLGASEFVSMKGKKELDIGRQLDALIVTTSFNPDWSIMLPVMAPTSTIFPITVSEGDFSIPHLPMILKGIRIQGTAIASRKTQNRMLSFASRHNIKPILMEFPMTEKGIEEAMATLRDGKMRYRGILRPQN